ncbi:MAG: bifunctional (p)ppGpp synthetase/guanosine-3',5'-bis(diphosphate) 3'-pyrophosphohydrolase [Bacteroidetes bacterium]|nr:bifunctional (p)ppGpp synthetase/guanosine-3',5'-bis(diphosphate) 3'-pyrophosphohydrolase [Bacteroidota bacterium]MBL7104537.1 bifunctional (p)ppGpp synthetase/guanosine-3',5'-bis(diphosphate) 3'-pyrophosphohydrolase [Bacteroidales bacterium]
MYIPDPEQERREIIKRYSSLLRAWRPSVQKEKKIVRKAFNFAAEAHKDMRRRTGEPYIYHPLEVARIAAEEMGLGKTSIICALLHDVVEDTEYTLTDIELLFGKKVAKIIDGLTKIKDIFDHTSTSIQAENFKRMLLTLSDDVRVILIKLADRLHNMRTLDAMPQHKQLKIASETTYLYAPLAYRFGLYSIKSELEDLSLKYTEPEIYKTISKKLQESEKQRKIFTNKFIYPINKSLNDKQFKYEIISRDKSVFSIWDKMKKKEIPFEEVYDLSAIRIIIDTPPEIEKVDCWRVYSIITDYYRPNIDRMRDWISIPKANGYEALHTTVMSKEGQWVEIQIRTKRMDEIAEKGYAAHWKYKDSSGVSERNINNWLERIRDMLQGSDSDALDFINDFQGFLITDEIYLFTPHGELRNLPVNSTVLDFAYAIHSEIGNTCIGAKVNYKLMPLNFKLKSGDQVEIITSKKQKPQEDWFNYVVTARARTHIKEAIKEEKEKYAVKGKSKLQKYFEQLNLEINNINLKPLLQKYNYTSAIDLYFDIAKNFIGLKEIKDCYVEIGKESWLSKVIKKPFTISKTSDKKTLTETIIDELEDRSDILMVDTDVQKISYDISNCCNPIPGDEIMGFIEPNEAIKIHRTNCPVAINLMSKYGNKIIKTKWNDKETIGFLTGIKISGIDKRGFINEIIKIITENLNLNIKTFHLESNGGLIDATIMLYVYSTKNLHNLIRHLKKLPDVKKAGRINSPREPLI